VPNAVQRAVRDTQRIDWERPLHGLDSRSSKDAAAVCCKEGAWRPHRLCCTSTSLRHVGGKPSCAAARRDAPLHRDDPVRANDAVRRAQARTPKRARPTRKDVGARDADDESGRRRRLLRLQLLAEQQAERIVTSGAAAAPLH
jgi:hypothetical protein